MRLITLFSFVALFQTNIFSQTFGWPIDYSTVTFSGNYTINDYTEYNNYKILNPSNSKYHTGKDYGHLYGQDIISVADGYVVFIRDKNEVETLGLGGTVIIRHFLPGNSTKFYSQYSHLYTNNVILGQLISKGDRIGTLGNTGYGCDYWDFDNSPPNSNLYSSYCGPQPDVAYLPDGSLDPSNTSGHLHLEFKAGDLKTSSGREVCETANCSQGSAACGYSYCSNPNESGFRDPDSFIGIEKYLESTPKIITGDFVPATSIPISWSTWYPPASIRIQIYKGQNPPNLNANLGFGQGTNMNLVVNKDLTNSSYSCWQSDWIWSHTNSANDPDIYEAPQPGQLYHVVIQAGYETPQSVIHHKWSNITQFSTFNDPTVGVCGIDDPCALLIASNIKKSNQIVSCIPDIYLSNYSVSSNNVNPNDIITISVEQHISDYTNGNINSNLKYWLSTDIDLNTSTDTYIGTDGSTIGTIPYESEIINFSIPNVNDGTYYILMHADSENILPNELREQNNIVGIPIVISNPNNNINLTVNQSSISGNAGESKVISGSGVYSSGSLVFVGTVTITTSNNTYTANMLNGNFSKQINLPPNSGSISVQLTDGTYSDTESVTVSINGPSNGNGYNVLNYTTCVSDDNVNMPCEFFSDHIKVYEDVVFFWIELNNNTGPTQGRFKIYNPDGELYDSYASNIENDPYTYFYYGMNITGTNASDHQGEWTVEYYARKAVSGSLYDYIGSKTFILSHMLTEHKMCKDVVNDQPVNVTNTFCNTDNLIYSWANYKGQCNALDVRADWYEPNGSLNAQVPYSLSDPGPEPQAWVPNRQQWMYLDMSPAFMKKKTGDWQIKYYSKDPFGNWDLEYTDNFQLIECPNVSPTISATSNDPVVEGQNVILSFSANDNSYLNQVVMYYKLNNGAWQTTNYNSLNQSNYSVNNISIGSYSEGDVIQFYAEATDNSGNVDGSGIQTIIIEDSDIDGPIISNVTISENNGNNDSYFQNNEILKFQATVSDPSGISSVQYFIDGAPISLNGNYFIIDGAFPPGDHTLTIVAYDNDTSQAISSHVETFHICDNIYYIDNDGDGYGSNIVYDCILKSNYSNVSGDCDDNNSTVNQLSIWYADSDLDGFGDPNNFTYSCYVPQGYLGSAGDCDDSNANISPNVNEVCDGLDNDCNTQVDENNVCCNTVFDCNFIIASTLYFEGFENGLGTFRQSGCDDMDWIIGYNNTPSNYTGPENDVSGDNYMYLEASNNNNKSAVIYTPCIDLSTYNEPFLTYYTHFHGNHMGSLVVDITTDLGQTWTNLKSHVGENGNEWYANNFSLGPFENQNIYIRFTGTTSTGYQGDMALDFIQISESCQSDIIIDDPVSAYYGGFSAKNTIQSNIVIPTGQDMIYHAGGSISLEAGFEVETGATFSAYIESCDYN